MRLTKTSSRFTHPLAAIDQAQRQMDELFTQFFRAPGRPAVATRGTVEFPAPASVWEHEDKLHVELELPGVAAEDVDVTVEDNVLQITAERKEPQDERQYWHNERRWGRVDRKLELPDHVDTEAIEAELEGGVLHLQLSKKPELKPKRIKIKGS